MQEHMCLAFCTAEESIFTGGISVTDYWVVLPSPISKVYSLRHLHSRVQVFKLLDFYTINRPAIYFMLFYHEVVAYAMRKLDAIPLALLQCNV